MAKEIAVYVQALHSDDEETHVRAANALQQLALDQDNKLLIAVAGAIPRLVELLRGPAGSKKHAAAVLWNVTTKHKINKDAMAAVGAVPLLVELLRNDDDAEDAAGVLANIANIDEHRAEIAAAGAIPLLVQVERSGSDPAKKQAERALKSVSAGSPQNVVAIARARGGLEALVVLTKSSNEEIRDGAVQVLAELAAKDFTCVVCLDARRSIVTLPCAHCSLCGECAATIRSSTNTCPICRGAIDSTVAFHLA